MSRYKTFSSLFGAACAAVIGGICGAAFAVVCGVFRYTTTLTVFGYAGAALWQRFAVPYNLPLITWMQAVLISALLTLLATLRPVQARVVNVWTAWAGRILVAGLVLLSVDLVFYFFG